MGCADYYDPNSYNVICDRCGFKKKAFMCSYDGYNPGLFVCKRCWKPPHPQEKVTGLDDDQSVPVSRPEQPDRFQE